MSDKLPHVAVELQQGALLLRSAGMWVMIAAPVRSHAWLAEDQLPLTSFSWKLLCLDHECHQAFSHRESMRIVYPLGAAVLAVLPHCKGLGLQVSFTRNLKERQLALISLSYSGQLKPPAVASHRGHSRDL